MYVEVYSQEKNAKDCADDVDTIEKAKEFMSDFMKEYNIETCSFTIRGIAENKKYVSLGCLFG